MDQARQILSETAGDQPTPQLIHVMDREIEEFHLVLKSGCQIEKLRLETWERLEKAVRVNSSVAARIVWLREVARATPEAPAKPVFYFPGPSHISNPAAQTALQIGLHIHYVLQPH